MSSLENIMKNSKLAEKFRENGRLAVSYSAALGLYKHGSQEEKAKRVMEDIHNSRKEGLIDESFAGSEYRIGPSSELKKLIKEYNLMKSNKNKD
jgi:hypothetical protein